MPVWSQSAYQFRLCSALEHEAFHTPPYPAQCTSQLFISDQTFIWTPSIICVEAPVILLAEPQFNAKSISNLNPLTHRTVSPISLSRDRNTVDFREVLILTWGINEGATKSFLSHFHDYQAYWPHQLNISFLFDRYSWCLAVWTHAKHEYDDRIKKGFFAKSNSFLRITCQTGSRWSSVFSMALTQYIP